MITDQELYSLTIFLGTLMMSLIVLYHFLSVNANQSTASSEKRTPTAAAAPVVLTK